MLINSINAQEITTLLLLIIAYVFSATFAGILQVLFAYFLGDDTAVKQGYLNFNPLLFIDPIGFAALIFLKFGWSKPVPFNIFALNEPFKELKIFLLHFARPLSYFFLLNVAIFSVIYLQSVDLNDLFALYSNGIQYNNGAVAQSYSSWALMLGLIIMNIIGFSAVMFFLSGIMAFFEWIKNLIISFFPSEFKELGDVFFLGALVFYFLFSSSIETYVFFMEKTLFNFYLSL